MQLSKLLQPGSIVATFMTVFVLIISTYWGVTEEIEYRHVRGVVINDRGEAMPNSEVMLTAWLRNDQRSFFRTKTNEDGEFLVANVPHGNYDVRVIANGYYTDHNIRVDANLEETEVNVRWMGDSLYMSSNQTVYTPTEGGQVVIEGMTREDEIDVEVYEMPAKQITDSRNLYDTIRRVRWNRFDEADIEDLGELTYSKKHQLTTRQLSGNFAEVLTLPELETGVYIVKSKLADREDYSWLTISEIGLITKSDANGVLAYVVDIQTGLPIEGAAISFATSERSASVGDTDEDGVLKFKQTKGENGSRLVTAEHEGSIAYSSFYWSPNSDKVAVHMQTDRPVYRPGDTVFFKGTVRETDGTSWRLPTTRTARVEIEDPDGNRVSSTNVRISGVGTFSSQFVMEDPELTGAYRMRVNYDGSEHWHTVPVMSYRKSQFRLEVTPVDRFYLRGDVAKIKVTATYYTGEPVVGSEINASAYYSSIYGGSWFNDEEYYEDDYYGGYGSYLGAFTATTDENGEAIIEVDTSEFNETKYDQTLTLSVGVSDESGRYFSEDGRVVVARGEYDLDASFSSYVSAPGETNDLVITATRHKDGKPAVGEKVDVEYGFERWSSRRAVDEVTGSWHGEIGEDGTLSFPFNPKQAGSLYATVTMTDSRGNKISSREYLWVYSYGARFGGEVPKLQIVLDKGKYEPADTARAIIRTSKPGGAALVTVEADSLIWSKVIELEGESTEIEFSDLARYAPNVTVAACYIRGKEFNRTSRTLTVELRQQKLNVEVTPSKDVVLPGEGIEYVVKATDPDGKPVRADIALSVVDEAIYAIREDRNDPLNTFYPRRWSNVTTSYSFPEIYLDGDDKAPIEVDLRKDFRDTAYWAPTVTTSAQGTARVRVDLPDNLTEWRATATAITRDTKVGKGVGSVIARKELMVRMSPPSFFVEGDVQTIGATVTNQSGHDLVVQVQMRGTGINIDRKGIREISLKDGENKRISWVLTALEGEFAKIQIAAKSNGGLEDGLEMTVPVRLHGITDLQVVSETISDVYSTTLKVDQAAVRGELRLEYAPTLLSSMIVDLDRLVQFPYGCVEQTMHRFLPAVVVKSYLGTGRIDRPELEAKIPKVTAQGMKKLDKMQHYDGGWGWWEYDESSPRMTGLVLFGLWKAKEAGLDVDPRMVEQGLEYSTDYLRNTFQTDENREDLVALIHGVAPHNPDANLWWPHISNMKYEELDDAALSQFVVLLSHSMSVIPLDIQDDALKLRDGAYATLIGRAVETDTTMYWSNTWWRGSTPEAFLAVVAVEPNSPHVTKTLRYLRGESNSYWQTWSTALTIMGVTEFVQVTGEGRPSFTARTWVNGEPTSNVSFDSSTSIATQRVITIPMNSLKPGMNEIRVVKQGRGKLYFSASLEQGIRKSRIAPKIDGGLSITRDYYRMVATRREDGSLSLMKSKNPVTSVKSGEILKCVLTIKSDREMRYVMVNDPSLSNFRIVEADVYDRWSWHNWWSKSRYLDDHAAFFTSRLREGVNVIEYSVRAEADGVGSAMPAVVYPMYQPEIRASTGINVLEVQGK